MAPVEVVVLRGNMMVGIGARRLRNRVETSGISGVGTGLRARLNAMRHRLFLAAVFLLCHFGNAEQLLVVLNMRRQFDDPLNNVFITVWRFQFV